MSFTVTVTPTVQNVDVNATATPYNVEVSVIDSPILDLTTEGTSGVATFNPFSGVLNIPNYSTDLSGVVPIGRTLTINGVTFDLSDNRSWTVPTHDAVTIGTANGLSLAGQVLSLGLASGSSNGALSSTDWTTFNNKQNALINPVTGTATSGQVAFWSGATAQTGDANLTYNATTRVLSFFDIPNGGIGDITNISRVGNQLIINAETDLAASIRIGFSTRNILLTHSGVTLRADTHIFQAANGANLAQIFGSGNLLLQVGGTFTDAGFRLDVNGTARVQGNVTIAGTGITGVLTATTNASFVSISMASLLAPSATGDTYFSVGRALTNNNSALFGHSTLGGGSYAFITVYGRPASDFAITSNGNIGIGASLPSASARLQIDSTTKGFLPPRMTSAQRDAIATPATGLMVYNTTDNRPSFFNGTSWINL